MNVRSLILSLVASVLTICSASAEQIGQVDTAFALFDNHKIVVEVYDDPKVGGASCYISRAVTGGFLGKIGLAEDKSDASVACRQIGPIVFKDEVPIQEDIFTVKASPLFKRLHVVRLVDKKRGVLTYLVYSDKLIDGSPKNSITAIALPQGTEIPLKK